MSLPRLKSGTTVVFRSLEEFREHYQKYLRHGSMLVESEAIDVGTRCRLTLQVGDRALNHPVLAVVHYRTEDGVGLAIERFADHHPWFRSLAAESE